MKKWMLLVVFTVGLAGNGWGQVEVDSVSVKAKADSLHQLARNLFFEMSKPKKALSLVNANLLFIEKNLGLELRYARSLNLKAICLSELGRFEEAEPQWLKCLEIREKLLGRNHPACADVLNNLGIGCYYEGRFEDAERFLSEANYIFPQHEKQEVGLSSNFNVFGMLYQDLGRYEESEKMLLKSLSFYENGLLRKQTDTHANILNNLGTLYWELGNYTKAEAYLLQAKSIREKVLSELHRDYISSIANLGILYDHWNLPEKAEPLLLKALELRRRASGKNSPDYASALSSLAEMYFYTNRVEQSKPLMLKAKKITQKSLGQNHPDYVKRVNNLGVLYAALERYAEAKKHLRESIGLRKKYVGKSHPDYLTGISVLAGVHHQMKDYVLSESLFQQAQEGQQKYIANAASWQSGQELAPTSQLFGEDFSRLAGSQFFSRPGKLPAITYDSALFYKGFLLQAAAAVRNRALADTTIAKTWHLLASNHRRLAKEYSKPIAERDSTNIISIEQQVNDLEKILVRRVAGFGGAYQPVLWENVQARLRPGEAAVEFVHFRKSFPRPTDSTFYAALLLRPGWPQPRFIPLFEERAWAANFDCPGIGETGCATRRYSPQSAYPLYPLVWQPLDSLLTGAKTVFFAPSGQLHLLNFGAIGIGHDSILSQKYRLVQVGSTRQLMSRDSVFSEKTQPAAILFGGVRYDTNTVAIRAENAKLDTHSVFRTRGAAELPFSLTDSTLRAGAFNYLQGTANEVQNIRPTIQNRGIAVHTFTGFGATEEAFKRIGTTAPPPRILHLATHGFFFPAVKGEQAIGRNREPVFKISDHPMIRSGLVLAGGNYGWHTSKPASPDLEDGILTAYEISQTNLRGTELVVLSACQTGLGDLHTNEGVYGLQRAFKIAGARYLVMSLWKVPDRATQELMTLLYQKWLSENLPLPDAFRATQAAMREKYPDEPLNWAGWVLVE